MATSSGQASSSSVSIFDADTRDSQLHTVQASSSSASMLDIEKQAPPLSLTELDNLDGRPKSLVSPDTAPGTRGDAEGRVEDAGPKSGPAGGGRGLPPHHPMHPSQFSGDKFAVPALLTLLGSFCVMFTSFGWINCIGVFQDYYETHQLINYSESTVSWIISFELFFMFLGGPFVGKLFDNYGPRYLLLTGTFFHVFGLMMASISSEYYQFLLSQGICSPIGASMLFFPAMTSCISWFFKRRALAFGVIASGASLGGVIFPIMVTRLVSEVGFGWTMRICAFVILCLLIIGNLTITSRFKPVKKPFYLREFVSPLQERPFALLNIGAFLGFLGLFVPISYIVVQASSIGMSTRLQGYLVPILNGASLFGRTIPGHFADQIGRFNMMLIMCTFSVIFIFAIWIPAKSNAVVIVFAVLYGFGSGAYVSIMPTLIAEITKDMSKLGVRNGTSFAIISVAALIGGPIGGALISAQDGKFWGLQIFAGLALGAGTLVILATRIVLAGVKIKVKV
ncbi:major facilitator superfamily domain-containing protein [Limtongia smithiae]|uniref:major facilitator superfamily domain-containing protein n=1 Tax=Limtongia smithiae TaxID=1125753 RepID=UPI0034CDC866